MTGAEVFVLFPEIQRNDPSILTEKDLYRRVSREKVEQAVSMYRKKMYERRMQEEADRTGEIDDAEMCRLGKESEKSSEAKRKVLLSAEAYRCFCRECEGCGDERRSEPAKETTAREEDERSFLRGREAPGSGGIQSVFSRSFGLLNAAVEKG